MCREVSGDVGGGTSSDEESVTPSSGSESDGDDGSDSDSESWGKVLDVLALLCVHKSSTFVDGHAYLFVFTCVDLLFCRSLCRIRMRKTVALSPG